MAQARLTEVTRLFVRVGTTVFGGGYPAIAVLQREFDRRRWLTPQKFGLAFGLARLTPGTNFLAFCAASGWYLARRGRSGGCRGGQHDPGVGAGHLVDPARGKLGNGYPLARSVIAALLAAGVGTMLGAAVLLVRSQCSRNKWLRPVAIAVGAFILSSGSAAFLRFRSSESPPPPVFFGRSRERSLIVYLLLLKATLTSFSGLASLPMVRNDFVVRYHVLTDRQLNTRCRGWARRTRTAGHLRGQRGLPGGWNPGRLRRLAGDDYSGVPHHPHDPLPGIAS